MKLFDDRRYYELTPKLKAGLFVAALAFILAFLIYTQGVMKNLKEEAEKTSKIFANLYATAATSVETGQIKLDLIVEEVIKKTDFPVIITDARGTPQAWKGVGIPPEDNTGDSYSQLRKIVKRMDKENKPIPLEAKELGGVFGYLHYGDSNLIHKLSWLPFVEIGAIFVFVLVGFLGFRYIKNSEARYLWVGMAKEAAHQMGTPLSSLSGWIELIKSKTKGDQSNKIVEEMENDLHRLNEVSSRFSRIGSMPKLKRQNLIPIISLVVDYFKRRFPKLDNRIQLEQSYQHIPEVPVNADLLSWAFENILKNSIDAIDKKEGRIKIEVGNQPRSVKIDFSDNGRGLNSKEQKRIFLPGYTTKKRGWGLGLSFVKRIIEEYHKGKVIVSRSKPGEGTTISVLLPCQEN